MVATLQTLPSQPHAGADIRTVRIDDEVWLVAMDLWKRLGGIREAAA